VVIVPNRLVRSVAVPPITPVIRRPKKPHERECMVRRTTARKVEGEKASLRKCIRPVMEISSPGHDELRACLSL